VPGTIEAERFNDGGAGVAYHDLSGGNNGGAFRSTDVDIEGASESGYDVGWIDAGEWLKYTIDVAGAGNYVAALRVASASSGGSMRLAFGSPSNVSVSAAIPITGGWQNWTTVNVPVTLAAGRQVLTLQFDTPGFNVNALTVTAGGNGGGAPADVVIRASDVGAGARHGAFTTVADPTAADGVALATPDTGYASADRPLASPIHYTDITFDAAADTPYRVWLRLRAGANSKYNDSVWVQFSDARALGSPIYTIGTASALLVNLATDSSASSLDGWGWGNAAYWLSQPTAVTFPVAGPHTLRIQTREDGFEIDQVVLSPQTYRSSPPGGATRDATIVPR